MLGHVNKETSLGILELQARTGLSCWLPYKPWTTILSLKGNKLLPCLIHFNRQSTTRYWSAANGFQVCQDIDFPSPCCGQVEPEAGRTIRLVTLFSKSLLFNPFYVCHDIINIGKYCPNPVESYCFRSWIACCTETSRMPNITARNTTQKVKRLCNQRWAEFPFVISERAS